MSALGPWRRGLRTALACLGTGASVLFLAVLAVAMGRSALESPTPTVQLRDRHGAFLGEVRVPEDGRLGFWPIETVPERVAAATLAIEDRRFYAHRGVDPKAVLRAVQQNWQAGQRISGASTLAMQVARLQRPARRTWPAKVVEAVTATLLIDRHGHNAVLRQYLTLAPYGNNVHGIDYAARRYFDKPVADLSWAETALLCAIPQAPSVYDPYTADGLVRGSARARRILDLLRDGGQLDPESHAQALVDLRQLHIPTRPTRPQATLHPVLQLERSADPAWAAVQPTTLDLSLQTEVQDLLSEAVAGWRDRGAGNAAALVVELDGLQVRAAVGSTDWSRTSTSGALDFTRTPRTPGSTLKPFLYAHALDRGLITPTTVLDDLHRGPDGIGNADHDFLGPLLPRQALGNSRNVPAVALAQTVGLDAVWGLWHDLGLHDDRLPASHYGAGLAIGGMPVRLHDLGTAYAALATDGRLRPLRYTPGAPLADGREVVSPAAARAVSAWLADPMARLPSFPRMGHSELPFAAAFKTGTSPDFRDAWAVGYTDRYLVVVWVGHPDWQPMRGLSGYRAGASLVSAILTHLHPERTDGLSDHGMPAPDGWVSASVCPLSGQVAGPRCANRVSESVPAAAIPVRDCGVHRLEHGRAVVDLPPRYAAWQRSAGLTAPVARPSTHDEPVQVHIEAPVHGARLLRDPEVPDSRRTLRLAARVDPPVPQVVWWVDGAPFAVAEAPYAVRWPVTPGAHRFEARVPFRPERSVAVQVLVD